MTLYIDIILIENMIMNYIILFATGLITKVKISYIRLIIASLIGSVYAIMSYVSEMELYQNHLLRVLLSMVMVYIGFYPKDLKRLIQEIIIFYLASFCFGGAAYFLLYYINPSQITQMDGILTGSYPIKIAILGGILGFFVITIAFKLIKNKFDRNSIIYNIEIFYQGNSCKVKTILDTGNQLIEPITALPVVVVEEEQIHGLIPKETLDRMLNLFELGVMTGIDDDLKRRCRLIPFSSIGKENGMMVGIKPDYIKLYEDDNTQIIRKVMIGIYRRKLSKNGSYSGLIGLELLNDTTERQVKEKV